MNIFWNSVIAALDIILVLNDCFLFLLWLKTSLKTRYWASWSKNVY